jgi:myo-inositol-1(or 4)-monophosphatase
MKMLAHSNGAGCTASLEEIHVFAQALARDASAVILRSAPGARRTKDHGELVTDADIESHWTLVAAIRQRFPAHGIMSEEHPDGAPEGVDPAGAFWIIDPLDGTANFARRQDMCAVSIAFARAGLVQVGVVAAPFRNEHFSAIRSQGAWLDGQVLKAPDTEALSMAIVGTGFPKHRSSRDLSLLTRRLGHVLGAAYDVRRSGAPSLDLCAVAYGRLDAFYERLAPWDYAAGMLIAAEAGARVATSAEGSEGRILDRRPQSVIASAPRVFDDLLALLQRTRFIDEGSS